MKLIEELTEAKLRMENAELKLELIILRNNSIYALNHIEEMIRNYKEEYEKSDEESSEMDDDTGYEYCGCLHRP